MYAKAKPACSPSDVEIKGIRTIVQGASVFVVGEAINHCNSPISIIIKLTLKNSENEIVDVLDWLGPEHGPIAPGETYAFKAYAPGPDAKTAKKIESAVRLGCIVGPC